MKTKPSLSILVIALAVIGFVVVSANEGTSAQPYAGAQFQRGGYCQTPTNSQLPVYGGPRGAGRGHGAGRGNWMSGPVAQIAQSQACGECDSGGCSIASSCGSGRGRGQGWARGRGRSFSQTVGCGRSGCGRVSSCSSGRGRGQGWARGQNHSCGRNMGRGAGGCCGDC